MKSIRTLLIVTLSALTLTVGATRLRADQPEMNAALEQLEKARHGERPVDHLEKAKLHLEEAEHNKHGERRKAIGQIELAIADASKGEHRRMEEHIDAAITEIHEGKRDAR